MKLHPSAAPPPEADYLSESTRPSGYDWFTIPGAALKRYLTPREAAAYLGVGVSTLGIHRMNGTGPKFIKWSSNCRYDVADLDSFMSERRVTPEPRVTTERRRVGRPRKIKDQEGKD